MIKLKSILYAFEKVWAPFFLTLIVLFSILFFSDNTITTDILLLMIGSEKKDVVQKLCAYLNTSVSFFLGGILVLQILNYFRKKNSVQVFNSNGNIYYDFSYVTFFIASKILGYSHIQLAGIPIGMQYKLVLRGTFPIVVEDMWEDHYENITEVISSESNDYVEVEKKNFDDRQIDKVNLIISDTHLVELDSIDSQFSNNPTIIVKSIVADTEVRYLNKPLVNEVRKVLQSMIPSDTKEIYIFSTANPKNNLNIITSCFRKFGRFQTQKVFVVQFNEKVYKKATRVI